MLMLPAAFVACTNEDIIDGNFAEKAEKALVEDLTLNISLEESVASRGVYAGSEDEDGNKSIFQNFYLEPEFDEDGKLVLTDNDSFAGDMLGFSLVNGSNAITNMPFYIAGYGSAKATTADAKNVVYAFDNKEPLYALNFGDAYTVKDFTKALYTASVAAVAGSDAGEALDAEVMDVRKGIVRNNAGVMSGNYIAYYPYNAAFTEPGGVPVVALDYLKVYNNLDKNDVAQPVATTQAGAIEAADFYNKLFAISQTTNAVNGKTKSGDVSLLPRTGAVFFKIYNSAANADGTKNEEVAIKRITVQAQENAAATDFVLTGTVPMDNLSSIVAKTSSSLIGAQFKPVTVALGYDAETKDNAQWVMVPCYPVSGKSVKLEVYDNKGRVAVINKNSVPGLGKSVTYTVDMKNLNFEETVRKIFTADDFIEEIETEGTLELMGNIEVSQNVTIGKKLTIKGNHKLSLIGATTINADLTTEEGVNLQLDNATINAKLNLSQLTIAYGKTVTLGDVKAKDVTIGTVNNNGTLNVNTYKEEEGDVYVYKTAVVITTLNNKTNALTASVHGGSLNINGALAVGTINNAAGATMIANAAFAATTINNAAGIAKGSNSRAVNAATITIKNSTSAANVDNKGTFTWNSTADMNLNIVNTGTLTLAGNGKFVGTIDNSKTMNVTGTVQGNAGSITNTAGTITVEGSLILMASALEIEAGKVIDNGQISGANNIVVAEGAEFVKLVNSENTLVSALGAVGTAAKYTGVDVDATAKDGITMTTAITATKKIYLNGELTFKKASKLNAGLEVKGASTVTGNSLAISAVTVNKGASLNFGANSNVTVNGTITNNGTFNYASSAVVTCTGIAGNGTWTAYPLF